MGNKEKDAADKASLESLQDKANKARVSESAVYSFMSKNPVTIAEGSKIFTAIQTLTAHKVGAAPVVDKQGRIVGVVSEHDLLIQTATRDISEPIQFTKDPVTVTPETKLKDALILLYKRKVRRIPVIMKDRTIVGMVTRMDVLLKLLGKDHK
jgi:IMP dehydrogenase